MLAGCVPYPPEFAARYRKDGYWRGERLGDLLRQWAVAGGDRTAVNAGRPPAPKTAASAAEDSSTPRMSYAELDAAADRLAHGLRRLGLARGERIVVQLPNVVEFPAVCFALLRLGVLPVFALPPHREHEITYLAEHSEATAYLACDTFGGFSYGALGAAARKASPALRHILLLDGPDDDRSGMVNLRRLLDDPVDAAEARASADADPPDPSDVALFLLSGGTTGLPKLIPRTHDDYAYNVRASAEVAGLGPSSVYLVALPAAHNFPLGCPGLMGTLAAGGRVVMAPSAKPEDAMAVVEAEQVTITALVPALAIRWLEANAAERFDLSSLEVLQVGGARLVPEVARRIGPAIGCRVQQVFGMAEGLLNYTLLDDPDRVVVETQGRPLAPADEILIVGPDGEPVADGEPGELLTRGPYTIRGYYRAEAHNASAFTSEGFYRTGDIVRRDAGGNLTVEGRAKDLINRGGEKISAEEIENLLLAHPAVEESAAVAMPHPVLGEQTCAYLVLRPESPGVRGCPPEDSVDLAAVSAYLDSRGVARFKWPERLEIVAALPVTNVGKIDKKKLREDIAAKLAAENGEGARP
ncbi:MAG: 2,3-dihydroxybenzoate---[aryl-carrier protein] ligase [Actinomycetota bacterium]|nr:2,3-dihydroxybenzoate---[aryl-carrier protein] ligase [Actinomycetota bacterium]